MLSSFQDRAAVLLAAVTFSVLSCCPGSVTAITNSHDHLPASQLPLQQHFTQLQYSSITDQLSRGQLSPQEQSHILTDIQQHRFLVNVNEGLRQEQSKAQTSFQQDPIKSGQHSLQQHPKHPPLFPPQQTFHHHFPQDSFQVGNIASTFANIYHSDKKPILLQPTYPQEYKSQSPQLQSVHHLKKNPTQQSFPQSTFQQTPQTLHQPKQSFQSGFQQTPQTLHQPQQSFPQSTFQQNLQLPPPAAPHFDSTKNFVASGIENKTPKHQQYLTEVPQPKAPPQAFQSDAHTLAPPKYRTQSWVLETQPPTPYKTQKPYDAITFATESYKPATPTPRVVKYRPSPKIQEEKNREEEQSDVFNKQDRKKLYEQLVDSALHASTPRSVTTKVPRRSSTTTAAIPTSTSRQIPDERYIQQQLQKQIQEQFHNKDNPFNTLKITLPVELSSEQIANLPNLALGDSLAQVPDLPSQLTSLAELPQSIFMANGQKVKLGASSDGKSSRKESAQVKTILGKQSTPTITTTTIKPPTLLFEELTKNVLPPGADFELIRQKQDGALEEVGNIQNFQQKKVTFVILEEQPDGSVKVQGVRGNENVQTDSKESDVEAIIERLKKGEIRLPPSTKLSTAGLATPQESQASPNYVKQEKNKTSVKPILGAKRRQSTTKSPIFIPSTPQANTHAGPVYLAEDYNSKWPTTTALPTRNRPEYTLPKRKDIPSFLPTVTSSQNTANKVAISQAAQPASQHSLSNYNYSPTPTSSYSPQTASTPTTSENHVTTPLTPSQSSPSVAALTNTLRANGLFAMAKFLRQSGLDSVLNGTDAYTLFVPTDKAFRALLIQLGGPDRAELKFKENPRLLSGLLLHHVIPGAFKVESLLDEMTGVSLAGTQLRVNTYATQDQEWNDIKVLTVNGARILIDKSDLRIPQGVAHTVDRVMFPLPVGDVLQTLMSDRENRFSKFIRLLQETGVAQSLQGTKSYTVFAPTDSAFTDGELERLLEEGEAARALALKHITPGTLYSAGMLYYQLRESMSPPNQIQLSKEAGRVKVNNAHVVSRNIPATNGVVHAIDSLL
ncbi:uncharacterized protein [Rhodnius prolixus]